MKLTHRLSVVLSWSAMACVVSPSIAEPPRTLIQNVRVFDGQKMTGPTNVAIRGGLIDSIGGDSLSHEDADVRVIDGTGKSLLPGLIDSHTHAFFESQLQQAAIFGVTTELDMLCDVETARSLRAGRDDPTLDQQRADYYSAGTVVTVSGGHGTQFGLGSPTLGESDNPANFVRDRVREGSDYIKLIHEDGTIIGRTLPTLTERMFKDAVGGAKLLDRLAVAHVGNQTSAALADRCGVDGLVHLFGESPISKELVNSLRERGAFVVPTAAVLSHLAGERTTSKLTDHPRMAAMLTRANVANLSAAFPTRTRPGNTWETLKQNITALHLAGVPILCGTDAPNPGTVHGASLHHELQLLVEAGLTPAEALAAATSVPAAHFGLDGRGRIAKGNRADLILVDGDPSIRIADTMNIEAVWKNGYLIDRDQRRNQVTAENAPESSDRPAGNVRVISNFDQGTRATQFGSGWMTSTDAMMGGNSTASIQITDSGAGGTPHAMTVAGQVRDVQPRFAGAMFSFGDVPMQPADIGKAQAIEFWARGDGADHTIILYFQKRGFDPSIRTFHAGADWTRYRFAIDGFDGCDGSDVMGVWFGSVEGGTFEFHMDQVALVPTGQ